jgi:hypothetical protein
MCGVGPLSFESSRHRLSDDFGGNDGNDCCGKLDGTERRNSRVPSKEVPVYHRRYEDQKAYREIMSPTNHRPTRAVDDASQ